jgi:hypothetical protein
VPHWAEEHGEQRRSVLGLLLEEVAQVAITGEPSAGFFGEGPSQRCPDSSMAGSAMVRWRSSGGYEELSWRGPIGGGQLRSARCKEEQREWHGAD